MSQTADRKLTGRHVALMLAGFFGLMFAVNGIFVYFALTSFSGVSVSDAYRKGLDYNQELQSKEAQNARGWLHSMAFVQSGDNKGTFHLKLEDQNGQQIADLSVTGVLRRPVREGSDRIVTFTTGDGVYLADIADLRKGQWDIIVQLVGGGYSEPYRLDKRIWVK
jgi:nitrogen fixation protein FixH